MTDHSLLGSMLQKRARVEEEELLIGLPSALSNVLPDSTQKDADEEGILLSA